MSWILAVQYVDYTADNLRIDFKDMVKTLEQRKFTIISFGACVSFLILIKFLNLFIPAAACAGASILWQDLPSDLERK